MRFVVAAHGTRGDIEPCAAVSLELIRRGHDVALAVPPNLVDFVAQVGLPAAVSYGVDSQKQVEQSTFGDFWSVRDPRKAIEDGRAYMVAGWADMSRALTPLAAGADLLVTGTTYQEVAANVAEHHGIPMAALHFFPHRANTYTLPVRLPLRIVTPGFSVAEWAYWRILKGAEDDQRRDLGLPPARINSVRRIVEGGALEIQAYDAAFFPGLDQQWGGRRPLVGSMTLALGTDCDTEVQDWIGAGRPPIYVGFGSMPVSSPREAVEMISAATAELGERVLISAGTADLDDVRVADSDEVLVVGAVNHATVFPRCRAVVHHGGAGTTAAGLRAAMPTLILWVGADQPVWAAQVSRHQVGASRRFTKTTPASLRRDLRTVLAPQTQQRAREFAARMMSPAQSVTRAADLLEDAARRSKARRSGSPNL